MSIAKDVASGNLRAAARLMRDLDDRMPGCEEALKQIYPLTGKARIIGITGNPGSGKSTLVDGMITQHRAQGMSVGVVAVDPSSPFSGGAILGDRIRMQRHALDEGVFIRSLATRGHLGGLSRSTNDVVAVMDAMGLDRIYIETVGVGQAEVDIVEAAHLSLVLAVPGLGDEVQALKAGVLEIADILVVNKADRPGADRTNHDLRLMLDLSSRDRPRPPILNTVAARGEGVAELVEEVEGLFVAWDGGTWQQRLLSRARRQVDDLIRHKAGALLQERMGDELDLLVAAVARRERDPYSVAEQVVTGLTDGTP
jgi:LAO/AO transport system kinase